MQHSSAFACNIRCHHVRAVVARPTCAATCFGSRRLQAYSSGGMTAAATASAVHRRVQAVSAAAAPTDPSDDLPIVSAGSDILRQVLAFLPKK